MKKIWSAWVCLSMALALAACGASPAVPAETLPNSPHTAEDFGTEFTMTTEYPSYAPSMTEVTVFMENLSETEGGTGVDFSLEQESRGAWVQLPPKQELAWTAQELVIAPKDSAALVCHLSAYDLSMAGDDAKLRIVKEIGGAYYAAEFTMSNDSPITPETPAGLLPMQDLPMDYPMEQAVADGCMVFTPGGETQNAAAMEQFLHKVGCTVNCQLRLAQYSMTGAVQLTDVRYEVVGMTGRFRAQYDGSRDGGSGSTCMGNAYDYSFLITDGWRIYLSNYALWDRHADTENLAQSWELLAGEDAAPYIAAVQTEVDANLADNVTRYRVWNGDGWAGLTELRDEFIYGYPDHGRLVMLKDLETAEGYLDPSEIPALTEILWIPPVETGETENALPFSTVGNREDMLLVISEETDDGYRWYGVFDPAAEKLVYSAAARGYAFNRGAGMLEFDC